MRPSLSHPTPRGPQGAATTGQLPGVRSVVSCTPGPVHTCPRHQTHHPWLRAKPREPGLPAGATWWHLGLTPTGHLGPPGWPRTGLLFQECLSAWSGPSPAVCVERPQRAGVWGPALSLTLCRFLKGNHLRPIPGQGVCQAAGGRGRGEGCVPSHVRAHPSQVCFSWRPACVC